jgi:hypothetical protein
MIDVGIAVFGAIFYFTGHYGLALLLILLAYHKRGGRCGEVVRQSRLVYSKANASWA